MNFISGWTLADAEEPELRGRLSATLRQACALAASDFQASVDWLRVRVAPGAEPPLLNFIRELLAVSDYGAISCTLYLLAQAHSADLAAAAGWHAVQLGCDDDGVIIALADVLQSQSRPLQSAPEMMHARASVHRSTAFMIKLADHYRSSGQAFLAEDVLLRMIRQGRNDLLLRLGEHWIEHHDWRAARDMLRRLTPDQVTPYSLYLTGRCCVSLLLEDEVIECVETLSTMPDPGLQYAGLLRCVWTWRVGSPAAAAKAAPWADFPPLAARDAEALRRANVPEKPSPVEASGGIWRNVGSREDLPNVLAIGMQRTATSWLWKQLSSHPDVQARSFKELVFFSDPFDSLKLHGSDLRSSDLGEAGDLYWQGPTRSLQHYRNIFADRRPFRIDVSPTYAELPEETVARIRQILGSDVKIILSVRDPVERSWSNLKYDLKLTGQHPFSLTFSQRIALYRSVATLRRCDYLSVLQTWRRYYGQIKLIFVDDVISKPAEVLAELGEFIGLSVIAHEKFDIPVNITDTVEMPWSDRMFLFGLHQRTYDAAEKQLGGPALGWRQQQLALLDGRGL